MATYSLVQRGVIAATSADGAGPKAAVLASAVKPSSAFIVGTVKDNRRRSNAQRGIAAYTNATVFPVTIPLAAPVDPATSFVSFSHRDSRVLTPTLRGATARIINAGADLEINAAALGVGETLDVAWEVIELKAPQMATLRLFDASTVHLTWTGTLQVGETIEASYDVFDIENVGDDLKEILFRERRILAYLGENLLQDLLVYDDPGNLVSYRLRGFDTAANMALATKDISGAAPLQAGEDFRVTVTQDIRTDKNDRILLTKTLTNLLTPTPGVN